MKKGTKVTLPDGKTGKVVEVVHTPIRDRVHVAVDGREAWSKPAVYPMHQLVVDK